jgi:diguanylate cyclase (GGDEF)-like protein
VILPDTPVGGAKQVSDNLRRAIAERPVMWNDGQISVTASFGITAVNLSDHDPRSAIARADTALYRAKQVGRNAIQVEEQTPTLV